MGGPVGKPPVGTAIFSPETVRNASLPRIAKLVRDQTVPIQHPGP